MSLSNLVELKTFNVFSEYFIGISVLYILIVVVLISYNKYGLITQKALSECMGLIMFLSFYLIINDDLVLSNNGFNYYLNLGFYKSNITDYFAIFSKLMVCLFSGLYFFIIADFLKVYRLTSFEYLLILLFSILGLILLCSSNDLLTVYISIELVSLSSYILASFRKSSSYSIEAGIKYLVTGAISSAFFLLGSSFVYAYMGSIYISDLSYIISDEIWLTQNKLYWQQFYSNSLVKTPVCEEFAVISDSLNWQQWIYLFYATQLLELKQFVANERIGLINSLYDLEPFLEAGIIFIIISVFIKLALAPFHVWSLEVYEGSPTISTFFFAVITKLSFFIFLVRFCYITVLKYYDAWQFYCIFIAFLSIFIGSFGGLRERKLKTLLAYSSVSHIGYSLLAFSTGTYFGIEMLLFYLIIYMLSGLAIWFIVLLLRLHQKNYSKKYNKELGDLSLLRKSNPAFSIGLSLIMFSIAGIPPLIGFFAKISVFLSILHVNYYLLALLSVICSVISTFYYLRIIKVLYFENTLTGKLYYPVQTSKIKLFSCFIFLLMFLFINPTFLYLVIHKIVWYSFLTDTIAMTF